MSSGREGAEGGERGGRGERGGSGRPPHLKGREIGLYYREMAKKRQAEEEGQGHIRLNPGVNVPDAIHQQVIDYLGKFKRLSEGEVVSSKFIEDFQRLITMSFDQFILEAKKKKMPQTANSGEEDGRKDHRHQQDEISQRVLKNWLKKKETSAEYRKRCQERQKLPATQQSKRILEMIGSDQVVLVVGSTGCGKTTQIPQLLLDESIAKGYAAGYHVVCTQPRRISAITVAERVAYERAESIGHTVGYQVRLERYLHLSIYQSIIVIQSLIELNEMTLMMFN